MISIDPTPDFSLQAPDNNNNLLPCGNVIDQDRTRAQLLALFCETRCRVKIASLTDSGIAGLRAAQENRLDLVFACLNFTDMCPAVFIRKIGAVAPRAKLILFIDRCSEFLLHLIDAFDYNGLICLRETDLDDLVHIIGGIQNGIRFVSPKIASCQRRLRSDADAFPKILTPRQMNVLGYISRSLSDQEIAARLDCSPGTILCHRRQIMRKLNVHTTPKLIRYAIEKGFDVASFPTRNWVQNIQANAGIPQASVQAVAK